MKNFEFYSPTAIFFGKDMQQAAGYQIKKYGKKILLHYGSGHIKKTGLYQQIIDCLNDAQVNFIELAGVKPNPRLSLVKEGIALCRKEGVDAILAVGGGSVIDSAKAIAAGVCYHGDVWDFCIGKAQIKDALPVGVVVTIPAAGSEASTGSVITNEEEKMKAPLTSEILRPVFAIMNPELTYTLPAYQTACGASDIMAHVMERYFTQERNVELTDRLCEATLKTVINNAPIVLEKPKDYAARAEIMWAGTIAHNDLVGTGRVGDWTSHNIEHELSAINDVAHGAGLAITFPAWMKYVYKHDVQRFVQFAVRVWNVEQSFDNPEQTALAGIGRLEAFYKSIGLPTRLHEIDISEKHFDHIISNMDTLFGGSLGEFVTLKNEDIDNILMLAR